MHFPNIVDKCLKLGVCTINKQNPVVREFNGRQTVIGHHYLCAKTGKECNAINCPILKEKK